MTMTMTIIGLYDDHTTAHRAVAALEERGFDEDQIATTTHEKTEHGRYHKDPDDFGPDHITEFGVPAGAAEAYCEGVRRGAALVVVRAEEGEDADAAAELMAMHGSANIDARMSAYKAEGYAGYDRDAAAWDETQAAAERERYAGERAARMKEIEERVSVGKRARDAGGVRLHKIVETEVVRETMPLRAERVDVERRSADRKASAEEARGAFDERTVEVTGYAEEVVVDKQVVVTGEVVVDKKVETRDAEVEETVRKTRVDVEEVAASDRR